MNSSSTRGHARVFFTAKVHPFSYLVRLVTGQRYSHVAVELSDGRVYEAVGSGCRVVSRQEFFKRNQVVEVHYVVAEPYAEERARSLLGRAYDVPAILWFLLVCLFERLTGKKLPRLTLNPRWLICSEYVWYIVYAQLATVTPKDLHEVTSSGQGPYGRVP